MWRLTISVLLMAAGALFAQQHSYTAADIAEGGRLYATTCGSCHGTNGDGIVGVDFSKGQYRGASTDEDVARIIRNGVPNTAMPASSFSEAQALTIVAHLRSMAGIAVVSADNRVAAASGDMARGKLILEGKGNCLSCHQIRGTNGRTAPDLATIAAPRRGQLQGQALIDQIHKSLLDPSADIAVQYRVYQVISRNGTTTRGRLLNQDTFTVQLRDTGDRLVSFNKSDLREYGFLSSPMPSFRDRLTSQEMADVVSYVISLGGSNNP